MKTFLLILITFSIICAKNIYYAPITLIYGLHTQKTTVAPITRIYTDSLQAYNSIKKKSPILIPDCCIISTEVLRLELDSSIVIMELAN